MNLNINNLSLDKLKRIVYNKYIKLREDNKCSIKKVKL